VIITDVRTSENRTVLDSDVNVVEENITLLSQLEANRKYYFHIYASNSLGEGYSGSLLSKNMLML
jgi:hypothetical protein